MQLKSKFAEEDAKTLKKDPRVESAAVEANGGGPYVEVTATDRIARKSLETELSENNFDDFHVYIDI
jgi:hypothetical protein